MTLTKYIKIMCNAKYDYKCKDYDYQDVCAYTKAILDTAYEDDDLSSNDYRELVSVRTFILKEVSHNA